MASGRKGFEKGNTAGFKKGQSGNPSGRKRIPVEVLDAARQYTMEAIQTLAKHMRGDDARTAVTAAMGLLNRGWGMPAQSVKVSGTITQHATELSEAELERIATGGSAGAADEGEGASQPSNVH